MTNVVFYGNYSVGKSTLINRIMYNKFEVVQPTIGAVYNRIERENKVIELWDTAGCERFNSVMPLYLRKADIIILCIDILDTINSINKKLEFIDNCKSLDKDVKIIIVFTKIDKCFIPYSLRNKNYFYTSAKNGEGVNELVSHILLNIPEKSKDTFIDINLNKNDKCWWKCC